MCTYCDKRQRELEAMPDKRFVTQLGLVAAQLLRSWAQSGSVMAQF